ncbi:hypothetical protein Ocin01_11342, partial [Orchesella cincta]
IQAPFAEVIGYSVNKRECLRRAREESDPHVGRVNLQEQHRSPTSPNKRREYRRQQAETQQNAETQGHRDQNTLNLHARSGVEILATPCGHVYCRDCIFQALRDKPECPECLSKLYIQNLNTIHF